MYTALPSRVKGGRGDRGKGTGLWKEEGRKGTRDGGRGETGQGGRGKDRGEGKGGGGKREAEAEGGRQTDEVTIALIGLRLEGTDLEVDALLPMTTREARGQPTHRQL